MEDAADHEPWHGGETFSFWGTRVLCGGWVGIYGCIVGALCAALTAGLPEGEYFAVPVFVLAVAVGALRGGAVKASDSKGHLVVRNPLRTYRFEWSHVDELVDSAPWWFKGVPCPAVKLRGRRKPTPIYAMAAWDRLVSTAPSRVAFDAAYTIWRWGTRHGVRVRALEFIRAEGPEP